PAPCPAVRLRKRSAYRVTRIGRSSFTLYASRSTHHALRITPYALRFTPMSNSALPLYRSILDDIRDTGLYKEERVITSQQDADIEVREDGREAEVLNFCANNYLGLANHPDLIEAAKQGVETYGF